MFWCFAKVNRRLAEIYFDKKKEKTKIFGHCYVKKEKYKTKREQRWIEQDSTQFQFVYKNGEYSRIIPG